MKQKLWWKQSLQHIAKPTASRPERLNYRFTVVNGCVRHKIVGETQGSLSIYL